MEALRTGWDFFQNEILGMKWLSRLIGSAVQAVGLDPTSKVGGSIQFFLVTIQDPRSQALPTGPRLTGESQ